MISFLPFDSLRSLRDSASLRQAPAFVGLFGQNKKFFIIGKSFSNAGGENIKVSFLFRRVGKRTKDEAKIEN